MFPAAHLPHIKSHDLHCLQCTTQPVHSYYNILSFSASTLFAIFINWFSHSYFVTHQNLLYFPTATSVKLTTCSCRLIYILLLTIHNFSLQICIWMHFKSIWMSLPTLLLPSPHQLNPFNYISKKSSITISALQVCRLPTELLCLNAEYDI